MKLTVAAILLLAGAVCGQWANWENQPQTSGADIARQFQSQDGQGQATFGYSHPGQSAVAQRDADGNEVGSYAYIDPEGREIRVSYIADKNGFRIVGNDEVAKARPVAHIQPVSGNFLQETPEVAAARAAHMQALNAALANSKTSNNNDWDDWAEEPQQPAPAPQVQRWSAPVQQQQTWTAPVQQPQQQWAAAQRWDTPQQVQETPEVAAARAAHMQALSAALANAQASGDDDWEEPAPVQQQPQVQRWSAPAQQQTWSAPAQQSWSAPVVQNSWVGTNQDTPDVLQAKIEFYRAFEAAAAANGVKSNLPPLNIQTPSGPQGPVMDTPEVAAAKAEFFRAFNAAASRSG